MSGVPALLGQVRTEGSAKKLMSPVQVVCLDSDSEPDRREIVRLDSDSESDVPRRIFLDETGDETGEGQGSPAAVQIPRKRPRNVQKGRGVLVTAEERARALALKQAEKEAQKQKKLEAQASEKLRKAEEKKARLESNRLKREVRRSS